MYIPWRSHRMAGGSFLHTRTAVERESHCHSQEALFARCICEILRGWLNPRISIPGLTIRLWDDRTGEHIISLDEHPDGVSSATFSADGSKLIAMSFMTSFNRFVSYNCYLISFHFTPRHCCECMSKLSKLLDMYSAVCGCD